MDFEKVFKIPSHLNFQTDFEVAKYRVQSTRSQKNLVFESQLYNAILRNERDRPSPELPFLHLYRLLSV